MNATFSIIADPAHDLIRMRLVGMFGPVDLQRFLEERRAAHAKLRCGPNRHLTLCDTRPIGIQTQDMVKQFGAMLADPAYRSRRLAFVTACTLARTQLQRAIGGRDARCFTDQTEAEAWLLASDEAIAA